MSTVSKDSSIRPECVLYVCCGSKCKKRGGKHLYKFLKSAVKENRLRPKVQVIKTGCADNCKAGPMIATMPENKWHKEMDEQKALKLLERAVQGE